MGAEGRGPRPFPQAVLKTCFLRVPPSEWAKVRTGNKRVFRGSPGRSSGLWNTQVPTPVVAWTMDGNGAYKSQLMVLEQARREPLGAIDEAGLAEEGFTGEHAFARFRAYWCEREKRRFRPLMEVAVYRVRPWKRTDRVDMSDLLLQRMYGQWL